MPKNNTLSTSAERNSELIDNNKSVPSDQQVRQQALGKISRRYAAYIVPAALAVLANNASAAPPISPA
jgi:hypothetical protein